MTKSSKYGKIVIRIWFYEIYDHIVGLGLHCLICFGDQISNISNYRKNFEYFVKFILTKIRINLHNMELCAQPIQNLLLRPLKSGYFRNTNFEEGFQ